MKSRPFILWLCLASLAPASPPAPDLLRFSNGDQLRGRFIALGKGPQITWQNEDLAAPAEFKTDRVRQIVLRGGRPAEPLPTYANIGLVNGDRLPGNVVAINSETITLDTSYSGTLVIPRDHVSLLAANPLGGRVFYQGPYAEDEWRMVHPAFQDGPDAPDDAKRENDGDKPGKWVFSGSAWYWQHKQGGTALVRENGMPENAILRFNAAWKNRLNLLVAFHSDFKRGKDDGQEPDLRNRMRNPLDPMTINRTFGNSYVLQLYGNYVTLLRTTVDAEGKTGFDRDQRNNATMRLNDSGEASIELRSNRRTGDISLHVNDEFITQWNARSFSDAAPDADGEANPFPGTGGGFGFMAQGDNSTTRISDIIVAEWNGMPDSARSMQVDDKDVVLMGNGTDRYAGNVGSLDDQGNIRFEGRHGSFRFPLAEVAEIRFARNRLAPVPDPPENNLTVRMGPLGSVSGQAVSGGEHALDLIHPAVGNIRVSTAPATIIEFNNSNILFDDWNTGF